MELETFQPSWPYYNVINPVPGSQIELYNLTIHAENEFSSPISNPHQEIIPNFSTIFPTQFIRYSPSSDDELQVMFPVEKFLLGLQNQVGPNFSESDPEDCFPALYLSSSKGGEENLWSPSPSIESSQELMGSGGELRPTLFGEPTDTPSVPITFPGKVLVKPDSQETVLHLLKAFGESMENEQKELSDVIMQCVKDKVLPIGDVTERTAFILSQNHDKLQGDYLRQEACKNFEAGFKAFYQIFPFGRVAHFVANSAILQAMPADAETLHVVDFDLGEGVQWPPLIEEAIAQRHKVMKLTAIKWGKEDSDSATTLMWSFEEAKKRLVNHARSIGLKLTVEEVEIEDLVSEIKKKNKRGGRKEWLAFNCMVGLPHMGRVRSRKIAEEFLKIAQESMVDFITFGDGNACENLKSCSGFGSFFEGNLAHYKALLDSIESGFPVNLAEARMALECLFVAPYISSRAWFQRWIESREERWGFRVGSGVQGWRMSRESLEEAREMVRGKQSSYEVRIGGGERGNEMILEWKGAPLVRVSTWEN